MEKIRKKVNNTEKAYGLLLLTVLFYYFYRYILKYNSTSTSPTYSDTPFLFQVVKYMVVLFIIVYVLFKKKKISISKDNKIISIVAIIMIIQSVAAGCLTGSLDYISFGLLLLPVIIFSNCSFNNIVSIAERILSIFWIYTIIYELVQIGLYITQGRLPALGYPTGRITDVRFGGAWDDPNGFALVCVFYVMFFIVKNKGLKRMITVGSSLLMLILTWSLTGIASCLVSIAVISLWLNKNNKIIRRVIISFSIIALVALIGIIINYNEFRSMMNYYYNMKQGSIAQHNLGWDISGVGILTWLGLAPINQFTEVGVIRLIFQGGLVTLVSFFILGYQTCRKLGKSLNVNKEHSAFLIGALSYVFAFYVSLFNLPHIYNFSCFGLLICIIIISCQKIDKERIL